MIKPIITVGIDEDEEETMTVERETLTKMSNDENRGITTGIDADQDKTIAATNGSREPYDQNRNNLLTRELEDVLKSLMGCTGQEESKNARAYATQCKLEYKRNSKEETSYELTKMSTSSSSTIEVDVHCSEFDRQKHTLLNCEDEKMRNVDDSSSVFTTNNSANDDMCSQSEYEQKHAEHKQIHGEFENVLSDIKKSIDSLALMESECEEITSQNKNSGAN